MRWCTLMISLPPADIMFHSLSDAVDALDLSSWDARRDATILAILLLERIRRAESKAPGVMERYFSRLESGCDEITEYEDNFHFLVFAASMLCKTYGLHHFERMGVGRHIKNIFGGTGVAND